MRSTQPPALAKWLLKQFGCSPNNNAIVGDLNERYGQGHSRLWYWRQVFVAIFISLCREIHTNGLLAIRALVVGWSLVFLAFSTFVLLLQLLRRILPESWTTVRWLYVRGWIVPAGDSIGMALMCCVLAFGLGWLMGRFHGPYHAKAVLIFVASWFVCSVPAFFIVLAKTLHDWSAPNWRYDNPYFLAFGVASNILAMLSTLAGGFLSGPRDASRREAITT